MTDETGKILRSYPRPIKGSLPSFLFLLVYHEQGPRKLRLDSATEWIQKPKKKEISEKFEGKKKNRIPTSRWRGVHCRPLLLRITTPFPGGLDRNYASPECQSIYKRGASEIDDPGWIPNVP